MSGQPSNPGLAYGEVPTAAEWNSYFSAKLDYYATGLPIEYGGTGATTLAGILSNIGLSNIPFFCGGATGSANAIAITPIQPSDALSVYRTGQRLSFKALATNTGATSIAVSGLAVKALQVNGAACVGGEVIAGCWYDVQYDGIQFQLSDFSQGEFLATVADAVARTARAKMGDAHNVMDLCVAGVPLGLIDAGPGIQKAMDSGASQYEFPDGFFAIATQLTARSNHTQNLTFIGSRTNTYLYPTVNWSGTPSLNTMINNLNSNGKLSFKSVRFSSDAIGGLPVGGFTGYYISADVAIGSQKTIFSGEIDDCWYSPSSVTAGFFRGGLQNYAVRNSTFEGCLACFTLVGPYNYDIFFTDNVLYTGYYNFIDASQNSTISGNIGITAGSATATSASSTATWVGQQVTGVGIPIGSRIVSVVNGVSFLMDHKATATNAAAAVDLDIVTQMITVDGLHSYTQQIESTIKAKGLLHSTIANVILHNTDVAIGAISVLGLTKCADLQISNLQAVQGQGGTGLNNAINLSGVQATFNGGRVEGATTAAVAMTGTYANDLTFMGTQFSRCAYGISITGAMTGKITGVGMKLNDMEQYGIIHLSGAQAMDLDFSECEIMNAGLDGAPTGRNISATIAANHVWTFRNCTIGQDNALALADYYVAFGGTGTVRFINCTFPGTPPVAIIDPASTAVVEFYWTGLPQKSKSGNYTALHNDANTEILHPTADNNARTFTIPANSSVPYAIGTKLRFVNQINTVSLAITTDTMTLQGAGTTGTRSLAANNYAEAEKIAATSWIVSGSSGLT